MVRQRNIHKGAVQNVIFEIYCSCCLLVALSQKSDETYICILQVSMQCFPVYGLD